MLQGEKLLVAGATRQVALPLTLAKVPWQEGFARMVAARQAGAAGPGTG